jgi:hypothetical protein
METLNLLKFSLNPNIFAQIPNWNMKFAQIQYKS